MYQAKLYQDKQQQQEKINSWLNKEINFGKYKNQRFGDILKDEKGVKYLIYLTSLENINEGLKYIILKLIEYKNKKNI